MTYSPDQNSFQKIVENEAEILRSEQIEDVKSYLLELRESHSQEFTKQIFNLLIFQIYNFLKQLESKLSSSQEVQELIVILQNPDDLELQFEYFNWLFIKIINHKEKAILPSNNKEFKGLSTSFYSTVGNANYQFAQEINQAYENKSLTLEKLHVAFTTHLIHSEPNGWNLCPDYQGFKALNAKYLLENPNPSYDEDE